VARKGPRVEDPAEAPPPGGVSYVLMKDGTWRRVETREQLAVLLGVGAEVREGLS
jgi:hypothetical protein